MTCPQNLHQVYRSAEYAQLRSEISAWQHDGATVPEGFAEWYAPGNPTPLLKIERCSTRWAA